MAHGHSVGVQHRHQLEDEALSQGAGTWIIREEEAQEAQEDELPRRLARMHPGGDEDDGPLGALGRAPRFRGAGEVQRQLFQLLAARDGRQGHEVYAPLLQGFMQQLALEVDVGAGSRQEVVVDAARHAAQGPRSVLPRIGTALEGLLELLACEISRQTGAPEPILQQILTFQVAVGCTEGVVGGACPPGGRVAPPNAEALALHDAEVHRVLQPPPHGSRLLAPGPIAIAVP